MPISTGRTRAAVVVLLLLIIGLASIPTGLRVWAAYRFRAGQRALQRRDFRQAEEHFRKYLEMRPDDPEGCLLAARTARLREEYGDALKHLRRCRQQGGSPKALALEYQLLDVQQGDMSDADTLLARCADHADEPETPLILEAVIRGSLNSENQNFLREMANPHNKVLVDLRRSERALDLWCRLRRERIDQVQGLVWRGMLHSLGRNYPEAQSCFRQALALDADDFPARLYLAELLVAEAPEEAAGQLELLRRREPDNVRVRLRLAIVRRGLGQLQEARNLLDEILASNPDNAPALLERGKVALDERQLDDAEHWLRQAVERAPNHREANLALVQCLNQAGKAAEAKLFQERLNRQQARGAGQTHQAEVGRRP